MLRIYFIQHWFDLADMACEEALYDSTSLLRFVGIDLGFDLAKRSFCANCARFDPTCSPHP